MFVCNESSILNLIGIVYLKVINVRFFFEQLAFIFSANVRSKMTWSQVGKANATPTPTPKTDTDSDPDSDPDSLLNRTIVQSVPTLPGASWYRPGDRANNRRFLRLFLADTPGDPGGVSEQWFVLRPGRLKDRTKKARVSPGFVANNPPFYVINNK